MSQKKNKNILLHKVTKNSNLMEPHSDYVDKNLFPNQNIQLLNTTVTLKYRDRHIADHESANIEPISRPSDDVSFRPVDIKEGDDNIIFTDEFIVLRADITAPYKCILLSTDYKKILVGSMNKDTGEINDTIYPVYTIQDNTMIGVTVRTMYLGSIEFYNGVILSSDDTEPCYSVVMEYLDEEQKVVRFITSDESICVVNGYYDTDLNHHDIDQLHDNESHVDIDPRDYHDDSISADDFRNLKGTIKSIEHIVPIRKHLLEGITILGE